MVRIQSLDRSKAEEVESFNEMITDITEYYYPGTKKPKKTWQEQTKALEEFTKFKGKKLNLKNFTKVKDGGNPRL